MHEQYHHHATIDICCNLHPCQCNKKNREQKYQIRLPINITYTQPQQRNYIDISTIHPQSSDVMDGLLKYNSGLSKYLLKYTQKSQETGIQAVSARREEEERQYEHKPNTGNIIADYKLNISSSNRNQGGGKQSKEEKQVEKEERQLEKKDLKIYNTISQQTSSRQKQDKFKGKKDGRKEQLSNQQIIRKHIQSDVKKSSRYLSNTGFRKYFNRQCFENYGRQNTNGVADGILYNGYLKTFNINPHSGGNLGQQQQVYHHALISGGQKKLGDAEKDPQKVAKMEELERRNKQYRKEKSKPKNKQIQSPEIDLIKTGTLISEANRHHKKVDKYKHIKLKSSQKRDQIKQKPYTQREKHIEKMVNTKQNNKKSPIMEKSPRKEQMKAITRDKNDNMNENVQHKQKYDESLIKNAKQHKIISNMNELPKKIIPANVNNNAQLEIAYKNTNNTKLLQSLQVKMQNQGKYDLTEQKQLKQKIVQNCFNNLGLAHSIQSTLTHLKNPCGICTQRKDTHCCCV